MVVQQQNMPVGAPLGSPGASLLGAAAGGDGVMAAGGLVPGGSSAASLVALSAVSQDSESEFGEMTGAAPSVAGAKEGPVGAVGASQRGGRVISLHATSGDGAAAPPSPQQRRVQFAGMTVIDVGGSGDGSAGAPVGSPTGAGMRDFRRQPSLIEVELASRAAPIPSPREGASSWLHD